MTKFIDFSVLISIMLFALIFTSCKQSEKKEGNEPEGIQKQEKNEIPSVVMDALLAKFPQAEIQEWTKEKDHGIILYDIELLQSGKKFEADIKEDGNIYNWEQEIKLTDLPEVVRLVVEKNFPEAAIKEIMLINQAIEMEDYVEGYEIVLETNEGELEIMISPEGEILEDSSKEQSEEK